MGKVMLSICAFVSLPRYVSDSRKRYRAMRRMSRKPGYSWSHDLRHTAHNSLNSSSPSFFSTTLRLFWIAYNLSCKDLPMMDPSATELPATLAVLEYARRCLSILL